MSLLLIVGISCAENKVEIRPISGPMTESVYASVKIEPEDYYDAYAAVPGILAEIYVEEGDTVKENQLIAKIKADNVSLSQQDAAMAVDLARKNYRGQASVLESFSKEITSVEEQFLQDSINLSRQQRLWGQKVGSKLQLETAQLKADLSRNTLSRLKTNYRQKENELESGYKRALNAFEKSNSSLSDFEIRSRIDGMVYSILKDEGEQLSTVEAIARIGSRDRFLIVMAIDEVDVARVQVGQKVYVSLDAYKGQVFEAVVARIIPLKDERTQTFSVEAQFIKLPDVLYAGLSGEANIVLSDRLKTLTIPIDYLLDGDKVLTEEGEVIVEVGMRNLERAEIRSGIDSSTVILKPE